MLGIICKLGSAGVKISRPRHGLEELKEDEESAKEAASLSGIIDNCGPFAKALMPDATKVLRTLTPWSGCVL
jgi:hypothetical protein